MTLPGQFEAPDSDDIIGGDTASVPGTVDAGEKTTKTRRARAAERFPDAFSTPEAPAPSAVKFGASIAPSGGPAPAALPPVMASFDPPTDDNTPLASIRGPSAKRAAEPGKWEIYTVAELVRFRDEITRQLPATELSKLNLEEEVLLQYHVLREMQSEVLSSDEVPANQRAQVANSVASILKTLGDYQVALYTSERFKEIENLLIRHLSLLPEESAAKFITEYEQILENARK